jgi:hypothetical protein
MLYLLVGIGFSALSPAWQDGAQLHVGWQLKRCKFGKASGTTGFTNVSKGVCSNMNPGEMVGRTFRESTTTVEKAGSGQLIGS